MGKNAVIEIDFSSDPFDQWCLSRAGGRIHIKPNGRIVFRFDSVEQHSKYQALKSEQSA